MGIFRENLNEKKILRSNFLCKKQKEQEKGGGRGKLFLFLLLFSICQKTMWNYMCIFFSSLVLFFLLHTKAVRNSESEEKQSLSLFTVFCVLKDMSHSQGTQKLTFSQQRTFTYKINLLKLLLLCEIKYMYFYKNMFPMKNIQTTVALRILLVIILV